MTSRSPIAVDRQTAAASLGVGLSTFDDLVAQGALPAPRRFRAGSKPLWSWVELDAAFHRLPMDGETMTGDPIMDRLCQQTSPSPHTSSKSEGISTSAVSAGSTASGSKPTPRSRIPSPQNSKPNTTGSSGAPKLRAVPAPEQSQP